MRVPLKKLLETLGVGHVLSPYETYPWMLYDSERGLTCSAEIRMGPGAQDVEAEIQLLKDEGLADENGSGREQIMRLRAQPALEGLWSPNFLVVKGENMVNKVYDWETKGCNFFRNCIECLQMNEMPEFDLLIEKELHDDDGTGGGSRGRVGRKSPKVKPGALMGMKKGM